MKKTYFTLLACLFATIMMAQNRVEVQVSASSDDVEENIPGANQAEEVGVIDVSSSDLELGSEDPANAVPQLVGIRFAGVNVPQGAFITNARIVFTVDNTNKNEDPTNVAIKVITEDNTATFSSDAFSVSSRPSSMDAVNWAIGAGTWATVGNAGADQTTPNLAALVQQVVNRSGWVAGNAMAFTIAGEGLREAESFDGDAAGAPKLVVDYLIPGMVMAQVSAGEDDLEEYADVDGQTNTPGNVDNGSSDLELGSESGDGSEPQLVGVRFRDLNIPAGVTITRAFVQFTVDESKSAEGASISITAEANANPAAFVEEANNISSRPTLDTQVAWEIAAGTWTMAGESGADQTTPDLSTLVQAAIDQEGWAEGNAIAFIFSGTGTKVAESYEGDPAGAARLVVDYVRNETSTNTLAGSNNDAEEKVNGGAMDITSSDLELGSEDADGSTPQITGLRFENVALEAGATVESAFIQFTVDENKGADAASAFTIKVQADANPGQFEDVAGNISSRATTGTAINWSVDAGTWSTVGDAGMAQRTPNIAALINEAISQPGWAAGNAIVIIIEGTGTKTAESFDGDAAAAPQLILNVLQDGVPSEVVTVFDDCVEGAPAFDEEELEFNVLSTYETNSFDESAAEIVAFDTLSKRLFFTNANDNTITILDITNPTAPVKVTDIDMSTYGGGINSIAIANGLVAAAVEATVVTDPGSVVFFDNLGNFINQVTVGVLPDMITFSPDGTKVLTADEGQPSEDYTIDPVGSVSIVDVSGGAANATVTIVGFESYNDKKVSLENKGVRITGPNASVAQDLEPEYIALTEDGSLAYVMLQENNALAVIDVNGQTVVDIVPQGYKNYNNGRPLLNEFVLNELIDLPALGLPPYAGTAAAPDQDTVFLGGFSGLFFDENESSTTEYIFYAVPDRGPNASTVNRNNVTPATSQNLRPFKLPDYQGRIAKFKLDITTGAVELMEQILLTRQDGTTPITGKGNIPGFDEVPVTYAFAGGNLLFEDFQNQALELNTFTSFSVTSDADWSYDNFQDDFFAEANGFGADAASNDWLISPALDLTGTAPVLSFATAKNFDGGDFKVLISTDYDGTSDPTGFNWTDLTDQATLSPGDYTDTPSGDIDISGFESAATYIAFQYISTGTSGGDGALWQLDDIKVTATQGGLYSFVDYTDNNGVEYNALSYDPFGGDFEGIVKDNDGNIWMCDEYRPAVYKFQPNGTLIERYVPAGTSQLGDIPQATGFYGTETLPANYASRRANRGFEAIAYDGETNTIYAFIQSPIEVPDNSVRNNSDVIRILGIDAATGLPASEYVYLLERNRDAGASLGRVDKIGDAVYIGNGKFLVLERDSSVPGQDEGKKYVYEISLTGATNILATAISIEDGNSGTTLEQLSADELAAIDIQAVHKTKVLNLPSIGYLPSDKPEGLALLPGGGIAVLNDNDFGIQGAGVSDNSSLGIIEFCNDNGIDASNRSDDIEIRNWPALGMFMSDAIKSVTIGGKTYIVSANEGDARDYDGFSEEERVGGLVLDPTAYPNAAELQEETALGRLLSTTETGDYDGDGDVDQIYSYGARSFSIWDQYGNLVYDSGNEFAQIIAKLDPANFNSNNDENDSRKSRSDDKGVEPEAIEIVVKGDTVLALVGLERQGGIMVYNISNPKAPYFVNYVNNRDFTATDPLLAGDLGVEDIVYIPAEQSPNGEALVVTANEVSGTVTIFGTEFEEEGFVFRIIHNNDGESRILPDTIGGRIIGGAAQFKTVVDSLKAIDVPTVTLSSGDNFLAGVAFNASLNRDPSLPFYDAVVLDSIGYDAIAIGNHDFDFGPDVLEEMIRDFQATQPPYLSANLNFSGEPGLQALVDEGRIAKSTIVEKDGQKIGVVGLIYDEVNTITTLRNVTVDTALVEIAQAEIDMLIAEGANKVILITHLQSISREFELIGELSDIDIVIAGGGDEFLTNDVEKNALPGLSQFGPYPLKRANADGDSVLVVTTPGNYWYVGNLEVKFNDAGELDAIIPGSDLILVADQEEDPGLRTGVTDSIIAYGLGLDKNIIAITEVDLDGTRQGVRTRETNQGNLIADAFLYIANNNAVGLDPNTPMVAVQNGGGIRNDEIIPAGSEISEGKTFDMLPFPNDLGYMEPLTPAEMKTVMEHAVSGVEIREGRFLQIAGFQIRWDSSKTSNVDRIKEIRLDDGRYIVQGGEVVADAPNVYIATNNFTAAGGDDFPVFGTKAFTLLGFSYQRALFDYIVAADGLNGVITEAQYPTVAPEGDERILIVDTEDLSLSEISFQATPAPFRAQFNISYNLDEAGEVNISLFNANGQMLRTIVDERQFIGDYQFEVDGKDLPAGTYMIRVQLNNRIGSYPVIKQ